MRILPFCLALLILLMPRSLPGADDGVTIVFVGDSTVASYGLNDPMRGWGQILAGWALPGVKVQNHAVSGTSSKSFRDLGLWKKAMAEKPNYVLIQFGHNDIGPDPKRQTDPESSFRENLAGYIREARAAGCEPILVTPPVRRVYRDGKLRHELLQPFVEAAAQVSRVEGVPLIDLYDVSFSHFAALTKEEAQSEAAPKPDDPVHFNERGASLLATAALDQLSVVAPQVAMHFRRPEIPDAAPASSEQ